MPQTNLKTILTLEQQIAASRRKLQTLWDSRGFTDPEVLAAGIELDKLLNQYQKFSSQTKT